MSGQVIALVVSPDPLMAIPLLALTVLLASAAAVLLVRSRKKRKWKPSKAEKRLLRGLDAYKGHAGEGAELLPEEWDDWFDGESDGEESLPDREQGESQDRDPLSRPSDSTEDASRMKGTVAKGDLMALKGRIKSDGRSVSIEEMDEAVREKAGREQGDELTPRDRLKGSVLGYERPTDPVWEDDEEDDKKS